jgi:hypothetical protein
MDYQPSYGLAAELNAAHARYWADGGPGKGSARYWADAVAEARELMERAFEAACESVEGRKHEERFQ